MRQDVTWVLMRLAPRNPPRENHPTAARETEAGGGGSQGQVEVTLTGGGDGAAQCRSAQAHTPFAGQQHVPGSARAGSLRSPLWQHQRNRGSTYVAYFCGKAHLPSPRLRNSLIPGRWEHWQGQVGPCSLLPAVSSPQRPVPGPTYQGGPVCSQIQLTGSCLQVKPHPGRGGWGGLGLLVRTRGCPGQELARGVISASRGAQLRLTKPPKRLSAGKAAALCAEPPAPHACPGNEAFSSCSTWKPSPPPGRASATRAEPAPARALAPRSRRGVPRAWQLGRARADSRPSPPAGERQAGRRPARRRAAKRGTACADHVCGRRDCALLASDTPRPRLPAALAAAAEAGKGPARARPAVTPPAPAATRLRWHLDAVGRELSAGPPSPGQRWSRRGFAGRGSAQSPGVFPRQ